MLDCQRGTFNKYQRVKWLMIASQGKQMISCVYQYRMLLHPCLLSILQVSHSKVKALFVTPKV